MDRASRPHLNLHHTPEKEMAQAHARHVGYHDVANIEQSIESDSGPVYPLAPIILFFKVRAMPLSDDGSKRAQRASFVAFLIHLVPRGRSPTITASRPCRNRFLSEIDLKPLCQLAPVRMLSEEILGIIR